MNRAGSLCIVGFFFFMLCASVSIAEKESGVTTNIKEQGIIIESQTAKTENLPDEFKLVYERDVKVEQKKLTMTCDRLEIVWPKKEGKSDSKKSRIERTIDIGDLNDLRSMTASGNVKILQDDIIAVSEIAKYDNIKRTITLQGGPPRLWQGPNSVVAHTIIIYIDEKRVEMRQGKEHE